MKVTKNPQKNNHKDGEDQVEGLNEEDSAEQGEEGEVEDEDVVEVEEEEEKEKNLMIKKKQINII